MAPSVMRGARKSLITRIANEVTAWAAESDVPLELIQSKLKTLEETFASFQKYHDDVMATVEDVDDEEQANTYFYDTLATYEKAHVVLLRWRRHKERGVRDTEKSDDHVGGKLDQELTGILKLLADQQVKLTEHLAKQEKGQAAASEPPASDPVLIGLLDKLVQVSGERAEATAATAGVIGGRLDLPLQTLAMRKFKGDYREWPEFEDSWIANIGGKDYSGAIKLRALKQLVEGEALVEIKNFATTDANYEIAWRRLSDRYKREKYIVNNLVATFIEQPAVQRPSATTLRALLSVGQDVVDSLDALKGEDENSQASSRDPWLIYILLGKLDVRTRELWGTHSVSNKRPALKDFFTFLRNRCEALEINGERRGEVKENRVVRSNSATPDSCMICSGTHQLFECKQFAQLSIDEKRSAVRDKKLCFNCLGEKHTVYTCKSKKKCRNCDKRHHSLLCPNNETKRATASGEKVEQAVQKVVSNVALHDINIRLSLLPTIRARIADPFGKFRFATCLLDTGSEESFCTESLAQQLQLERTSGRIKVNGIGGGDAGMTKGRVKVTVSPHFNSREVLDIDALVLHRLTSLCPRRDTHLPPGGVFGNMRLADPDFSKPRQVDIILGSDVLFRILRDGKVFPWGRGGPVAVQTTFGWLISGQQGDPVSEVNSSVAAIQVDDGPNLERQLEAFWRLEEVGAGSKVAAAEGVSTIKDCDTFSRDESGRFIARLPFDDSKPPIGDSLAAAIACMRSMERRCIAKPELKRKFVDFIREYQQLGHMELVPPEEIPKPVGKVFYLPYHEVYNENSTTTKFRVVFNGSKQPPSGSSLNGRLKVGPTVQRELVSILLAFRLNRYAVTADIEKMYRQILVPKKDADFQRIVWRENPAQPIEHWRLTTVVYGTASASYCATKPLVLLADENKEKNPRAALVIKENFYIDDAMFGEDELDECIQLQKDVDQILKGAQMKLRKWAANHPALLEHIPSESRAIEPHELNFDDRTISTLGISWNPALDEFSYKIKVTGSTQMTKRRFLPESAKLFDPLGWLAPVIVAIKIQFQKLWHPEVGWDQLLPEEVQAKWDEFEREAPLLAKIRIPRWLPRAKQTLELIGFADASSLAYGSVVYGRTIDENGTVQIRLLMAKTKVAPRKMLTIPRLELCAALLLSKTMAKVLDALSPLRPPVYAFSDSTVVLSWLAADPGRWQVFVQNRCTSILEYIPRSSWSHVAGVENPADAASRGLKPSELISCELWWQGPPWLKRERQSWPARQLVDQDPEAQKEARLSKIIACPAQLWSPILLDLQERISSFERLLRITGYVKRLIKNWFQPKDKWIKGPLIIKELRAAELAHIRTSQAVHFKEEIDCLEKGQEVSRKSKILSLSPRFENEILRVGGRLENARWSLERRHPIILHPEATLSTRIISAIHRNFVHAGPTLTMNLLRQKYWIPRSRPLIRKLCHKCIPCFKQQAGKKPTNPIMGALPSPRVQPPPKCFHSVGVDFAGPINLRPSSGRGNCTIKAYICLFICLSSRAIHLEVAADLSSLGFLKAFKRFLSRRGHVSELYSDCGTNFTGAVTIMNESLDKAVAQVDSEALRQLLLQRGTTWHFNPPAAPHMGGIWEAGIKSSKLHLNRALDTRILTFEEYGTLLCEIEACLNSRPLCALTEDVSSLDALTPGHFLHLDPPVCLPEEPTAERPLNRLTRYQLLRRTVEEFWRRWSIEYIASLQPRGKWRQNVDNLDVGDLVMIREDNAPPAAWALGRVSALHPGKDRVVRVVTVRHKGGEFRRPVTKLAKLPVN